MCVGYTLVLHVIHMWHISHVVWNENASFNKTYQNAYLEAIYGGSDEFLLFASDNHLVANDHMVGQVMELTLS